MKRAMIFVSILFMLTIAAVFSTASVSAQGTIIVRPTSTPVPDSDRDGVPDNEDQCPNQPGPVDNRGCPSTTIVIDRDGDGTPDADDQCPTVAGPRENRGCPVQETRPGDNQTTDPNPGDLTAPEVQTEEPFRPPALPVDGCYVTPALNNNINVRKNADISADIIGFLMPGRVYNALGYVMQGTDIWFMLSSYEGTDGSAGYASRSVLLASTCAEIAASSPEAPDNSSPAADLAESAPDGNDNPTVEYCVYQEVQEAGVFQEVCYEIEVPEGCTVTSSEAGVFDIDCGDGPVQVNPLFDGLPTELNVPSRNGEINIALGVIFGGEGEPENPTVEYCIYQEVQEAGVFQEVCYEIEVPEGCTVVSSEAGVFTFDCGDGPVQVNPLFDGRPADDLASPKRTGETGIALQLVFGTSTSDENPTIEYCVYQEVQEAGVFQEVCYEIEVPEGCTVVSSEAGVFTFDCGGDPVTVNPLFDDLPAEGLSVPTRDSSIGIGLGIAFGQGGDPETENPTIEYCTYEEVDEAGVFKEVCHEIEIPDGCWLQTAEAGVFTIKCRPEIGGEVGFAFNRNNTDGTIPSN